MKANSRPLPCLKCGDDGNIHVYQYDHGIHHVECVGCNYLGPPGANMDQAIALHNEKVTVALKKIGEEEMLRKAKEAIKGEVADEADWTFDSQSSGMQIDAVCHRAAVAATAPYLQEIARLRSAVSTAQGYMLNAAIDLQTGTKKATTLATLNGGIARMREALNEGHDQ